MVERNLAKVEVAGPSPVCRSSAAAMVELVDTRDLKSLGQKWLCGFKSRFEYKILHLSGGVKKHTFFFTHKAPTFTSWGFVIT